MRIHSTVSTTVRRVSIAVLAMSAALALPAMAATYYASPTGSGTGSGTLASPWSMSKANSSLVAGDVVILLAGTYSTSINPANSGNANARISYVGSLANPAAVVVPSIQPSRSYISVKGVTASNGCMINKPARFDSVAYCVLRGAEFWGAQDCIITRNTINGTIRFRANDGLPCYTSQNLDPACNTYSIRDTLRYNRIDLGIIQPNSRSFEFKAHTQYCVIDSNRIQGRFDNNGSTLPDGGDAMISYNGYYQTFRDNHWEYEATSAHNRGTPWTAFYLRDSSSFNLFERDTVLAGVNSPGYTFAALLSASGSFPASVQGNTMRGCVFKLRGDLYTQDGFRDWVVDNNVFASASGMPFWIMGTWSNSKVRHNALWGTGEVFRIEGGGSNKFAGGGNEITSNIFYSTSASSPSNSGGVTMWKESTSGFTSNNNLFFTPGYQSQVGDRSIVWSGYYNSRPGSGQPWYQLNGQDGVSRHGSPMWADSSFATLDTRLRTGSSAIGLGAGGTDAGPLPFGGGAVDAVPPSTVADLAITQVTDTGLLLTWTAPGDDGASGIAQSYDLRYSTSAITSSNFGGATPFVVQPVPGIGGSPQSYVVSGLTPGASYWFAIRARDDWGNWSGVSNAPTATTTNTDTVAPARVTDLSGP